MYQMLAPNATTTITTTAFVGQTTDVWAIIASVATAGTLLVLLPSTIDTLYTRFF